jgi:nitrogen fixation/metabolism regulation signal transduction histidine kinase
MSDLDWKGPDFFGFFYVTTETGRTLNVRYEENRDEKKRGWVAYVGDHVSPIMHATISEAKDEAVRVAHMLDLEENARV